MLFFYIKEYRSLRQYINASDTAFEHTLLLPVRSVPGSSDVYKSKTNVSTCKNSIQYTWLGVHLYLQLTDNYLANTNRFGMF